MCVRVFPLCHHYTVHQIPGHTHTHAHTHSLALGPFGTNDVGSEAQQSSWVFQNRQNRSLNNTVAHTQTHFLEWTVYVGFVLLLYLCSTCQLAIPWSLWHKERCRGARPVLWKESSNVCTHMDGHTHTRWTDCRPKCWHNTFIYYMWHMFLLWSLCGPMEHVSGICGFYLCVGWVRVWVCDRCRLFINCVMAPYGEIEECVWEKYHPSPFFTHCWAIRHKHTRITSTSGDIDAVFCPFIQRVVKWKWLERNTDLLLIWGGNWEGVLERQTHKERRSVCEREQSNYNAL